MAAQILAQANFLDAVTQRFLDKIKRGFCLFSLFFCGLLFFLAGKAEIVLRDVAQFLVVILAERLRQETVNFVRHKQHVVALVFQLLELRQLGQMHLVLAVCKVDVLLLLRHRGSVLLE